MSDASGPRKSAGIDPRHLLAAAIVWVLGLPLLGLIAAILRFLHARDVTDSLPPDQRASYLAAAIAAAMQGTVLTSVLSALGVPVLVVLLVRRRRLRS